MRCKICGGAGLSKLYTIKSYDIWRCSDCDFAQVFISPDELSTFYDEAYFKGEKASFDQEENIQAGPAHAYWMEKQLSAFPPGAPLHVLEIGPGAGGPLAGYLRDHHPEVVYEAVEISSFAAERLKLRNFTIHTGTLSDPKVVSDCEGRFDLVVGTEVIEHDPEPVTLAQSVFRVLKPGGRCAFTTGNLDGWMARIRRKNWYYLDPPAHVSFYNPTSAKRLFYAAGFSEVGIWKVGFNYINLALKTGWMGALALTDLLSLPTGMVISATKSQAR